MIKVEKISDCFDLKKINSIYETKRSGVIRYIDTLNINCNDVFIAENDYSIGKSYTFIIVIKNKYIIEGYMDDVLRNKKSIVLSVYDFNKAYKESLSYPLYSNFHYYTFKIYKSKKYINNNKSKFYPFMSNILDDLVKNNIEEFNEIIDVVFDYINSYK